MIDAIFDQAVLTDKEYTVFEVSQNERVFPEAEQSTSSIIFIEGMKFFSFAFQDFFDNSHFSEIDKIEFIKSALIPKNADPFGGIWHNKIDFFSECVEARLLIEGYLEKLSNDKESGFYFRDQYALMFFKAINLLPGATELIIQYFEKRNVNEKCFDSEVILIYALIELGKKEEGFVFFETIVKEYKLGEPVYFDEFVDAGANSDAKYLELLCLHADADVADFFFNQILDLCEDHKRIFDDFYALIRYINPIKYKMFAEKWNADVSFPAELFPMEKMGEAITILNNLLDTSYLDLNSMSSFEKFYYSKYARRYFISKQSKKYLRDCYKGFYAYSRAFHVPNHFVHNFKASFGVILKDAGHSDIQVKQTELDEVDGDKSYRVDVLCNETAFFFTYNLNDYNYRAGEELAYANHFPMLAKAINLCLIRKNVPERFIEYDLYDWQGLFMWVKPSEVHPIFKRLGIYAKAAAYDDDFYRTLIIEETLEWWE